MNLFPTTVKGQSVYIFAILLMTFIMFTQAYGWYNWAAFISRKPQETP